MDRPSCLADNSDGTIEEEKPFTAVGSDAEQRRDTNKESRRFISIVVDYGKGRGSWLHEAMAEPGTYHGSECCDVRCDGMKRFFLKKK